LNRLHWAWQRVLAAIGWQGTAGMALIATSVSFWMLAVVPANGQVADLRAQAVARLDSQRRLPPLEQNADPASQLRQFYAFFTREQAVESWLARLYDIGDRDGLLLRQAEYQVAQAGGLKLSRYRIVLPVTGTYPQLKHFLATTLAEIPIIALDRVTLHKRKAGDPVVDANLQFTLYLLQES